MSVDTHVLRAFQRLSKLSTFVEFQSVLLGRVKEETGNEEEFLREFHALAGNVAKVKFLHERLQSYDLLRDKFTEDKKSDRKADRHRRKGDNAFVSGQIIKSLQHYSRCIVKAESEELRAKGYANRSAALFKLELYRECLVDIERAIAGGYPEQQRRSLLLRKEKATELANNQQSQKFYEPVPEVPSPNPATPCLSSSLDIILDAQSKRRIFAAEDIKVGEIMAVETPLSYTVCAADLYHCHYCFELCYNAIPCETCCQAVYCNESCRGSAAAEFHTHECPLMISLKNFVGKYKAFILAVKITFTMEADPSVSSAEHLRKLVENLSTKNINDEVFTIALVTALIFHLVKHHTSRFASEDLEDQDGFVDALMTNLRVCLTYAAGIDELRPNQAEPSAELTKFRSETVGCALFPVYALYRHACCPNLFAHHHGTKRVLRATRAIKKGDECFASYGPHYVEHPLEQRQSRLSSQYHFTCRCKACTENWPQLDLQPYYVRESPDVPLVYQLRSGNLEIAKTAMDVFVQRIENLQADEPSSDLIIYQKLLSYCCDLSANKRRLS